jgi:hypothetical protein
MTFKEQYIPATKRKSIQHLYDEKNPMKPSEFLSFCRALKPNPILTNKNSKFSEKIDGFGFRFGLDSYGNFFIESSNSGPIFSKGSFRNHSTEKHGSSNEIAEAYEQLFEQLESNKKLQFFLGDNNKNGIKVVCECLFTSLGKKNNGKIKFVSIEYDEDKLGKVATFSIIKITDARENAVDCVNDLWKMSDENFKFVSSYHPEFQIDFSKEVFAALDIPDAEISLKNMKKDSNSVTKKKEVNEKLLTIQKQMKENVLGKYRTGILGDSVEGFVLDFRGFVVKFVTDDFRNGKV